MEIIGEHGNLFIRVTVHSKNVSYMMSDGTSYRTTLVIDDDTVFDTKCPFATCIYMYNKIDKWIIELYDAEFIPVFLKTVKNAKDNNIAITIDANSLYSLFKHDYTNELAEAKKLYIASIIETAKDIVMSNISVEDIREQVRIECYKDAFKEQYNKVKKEASDKAKADAETAYDEIYGSVYSELIDKCNKELYKELLDSTSALNETIKSNAANAEIPNSKLEFKELVVRFFK